MAVTAIKLNPQKTFQSKITNILAYMQATFQASTDHMPIHAVLHINLKQ